MNKGKLSVTVAILAYNEEKYIVDLVRSIYSQTRSSFTLNQVCLYYDAGTDSTVSLVKKYFPQVKIYNFKKNRGKIFRVNQLLRHNTSDILIQIDADVLLKDSHVFSHLVAPFYSHPRPGIVCAYHQALPAHSLIGRIAFFGFRVWDRSRNMLGRKGIRYYCEGGLRAFSRRFSALFRIPPNRYIDEDTYSFFYAVSHGFQVKVAPKAIVFIDFPYTFRDYARQMKRFLSSPRMAEDLFDQSTTDKYLLMTTALKIQSLFREFINDPLIGLAYIFVQGLVKIQMPFYHPPVSWIPVDRKKA